LGESSSGWLTLSAGAVSEPYITTMDVSKKTEDDSHLNVQGVKMDIQEPPENECEDLTITIPCELADRVRRHGEKTATDLNTIMIEALDAFLRDAKQ
jgi:hypothetical protein